jgi:hypothetical protein
MWTSAPVRFREDANAEEELALGGYRDRVVVELAQNAADAAVRAGVPGRLLLRVDELEGRAVLLAANTGAPLDAAGVLALATLRASAKRDDAAADDATVGRFGVGFSAVLAVTDEPVIVSRHGGVRFAAADTRDLLAEAAEHVPGLAEELARRDGHVPVLRLPFPAEGTPPDGYDTAVLLPLRDAAAEDLALRLLAEVGDPLLLGLPGLAEITVVVPGRPARTVSDVQQRWHVLRRGGELDAAVLADRPTEERARRAWSVTWAVPREADAPSPGADPFAVLAGTPGAADAGRAGAPSGVQPVVHAPTPSDEPLPWPALLVATFPLDSSRRHVAPGPATDAIVQLAADAYAELLAERASAGGEVWELVPVGLPAGPLDAALREAVLARLPRTPLLPDTGATDDSEGPVHLLPPRDALALEQPAGADPGVIAVLAPWLAGLVRTPRGSGAVLSALRVRTITLADAIEQLPAPYDPAAWRRTYEALAGLTDDPLAREALAALPVPLVDGRVVRGVRGLLLPAGPVQVAHALTVLRLRAVHPDAAHPLLERLGAVPVDARAVLDLTAVRELVAAAAQEVPEPDPLRDPVDDPVDGLGTVAGVADAVLELVQVAVAAGALGPEDLPYLADLWLADADGEPAPAGALLLPGSVAERLLDPDEVSAVDAGLLRRWGADTLAAVGVLDRLGVLHLDDVPLDPDAPDRDGLDALGFNGDVYGDLPPGVQGGAGAPGRQDPRELDGWDDWVDDVLAALPGEPADALEASVIELLAVHDLDLIREQAWPQALELLAQDPWLRSTVTTPARVRARVVDAATGARHAVTVDVPSYPAWWLSRRLVRVPAWADPDAEPGLATLLPPAPALVSGLDPQLRRALGAVATVADLGGHTAQALVDALAEPDRDLDAAAVLQVWAMLAQLAVTDAGGLDVEPPEWVRVLEGAGSRVVRADQAVVVDDPVLLQRTDLGLPVLAAGPQAGAALAALLDLPLAADLVRGAVDEDADPGTVTPVPVAAGALVPQAPVTWCEHDRLVVDGVEVEWWVEPADDDLPAAVHACTVEGLACGLAWAGRAWHRRAAVAQVLADPAALPRLVAEEVFAPSGRIEG